jgi:hypothetical protein
MRVGMTRRVLSPAPAWARRADVVERRPIVLAGRVLLLCSLVSGSYVVHPGLGRAQLDDHETCYKVSDPLGFKGIVNLSSNLGVEAGCRISKSALLCIPSTKAVVSLPFAPLPVSAAPADGPRICYKVKCPDMVPTNLVATDQFGTRTFTRVKKVSMLCTPATTHATYCGDGVIDPGEQCEGANLNGATCGSIGYTGGALGCAPGCRFDTSGCAGTACTGGMPATGQTTSYTPGDDGDVRAGKPLSYTDNGDGTFTDNNTGLVWEKKGADGGLHDYTKRFAWQPGPGSIWEWIDQVNAEDGHGLGWKTDWRIPNVRELQSILIYTVSYPQPQVAPVFNTACTPGCTTIDCSCTAALESWSSTASADVFFPNEAWWVRFDLGVAAYEEKSEAYAVRAVRGGN